MRNLLIAFGCSISLGACATGHAVEGELRPTLVASLPAGAGDTAGSGFSAQDDERQPAVLPVGIGLTAGPGSILIGAAYDIPIDANLSAGPALQLGFDDDVSIIAPHIKLKYRLPGVMESEDGTPALKPYLTFGVGGVYMDKTGRSSDTSLLINGGAGFRFLTGESYRLGTEALVNWAPGKVAGELGYFSWEIVQVAFEF